MSDSSPRSYYAYTPSLAAAIIFAILYTLAFIATVIQWIRYRAWVWVVMVVAAFMEALGYIARSASAQKIDNRRLYIAQFCLIVLAPVLMAAAYYVIFGRIVYHVLPPPARTTKLLWVPPRFVTPIFVTCDIIALLTQLYGAVIVSGTQVTDPDAVSKFAHGKQVVLIGLGLQVACFGLFSIIAIRFHFTSKRFAKNFDQRVGGVPGETNFSVDGEKRKFKRDWETLLWMVNVACILVLVSDFKR
ncbi:hypothetical protein MMC32_001992 [Xylographa parallela]|nr:hypothetical protein [Xylographa parallela]